MTLSVRLLYVINTPEYLQFLADENKTNGAGATALELYEGLGPVVPLELASWSQTVPLVGLMAPEPGTSSGSSGGEPGTETTATPGSSSGSEVPTTGGGGASAGETGGGSTGGAATGGDGEGGCGCRGGGEGTGWLWAPLLVLLARRQGRARGTKRARTAAA
jgi:hypothetical protein